MRLAYRSCHVGGCLVPFRLTDDLQARFRKDAAFTLRLFDLGGQPVNVTMSLAGFSAAMKGLD